MKNNFIFIKLIKSVLKLKNKHKLIIICLKIKKINSFVILYDTPNIRNIIKKFIYVLKIL